MSDKSADEYQFSITIWGYNFPFIITCIKFILKSIFLHVFCFITVKEFRETLGWRDNLKQKF